MNEGVIERGKRLLKEESAQPPKPLELAVLKKQVEDTLQKVEVESTQRRRDFEVLLTTVQKTAQLDLENAELERDILTLVKQYFERKTRVE